MRHSTSRPSCPDLNVTGRAATNAFGRLTLTLLLLGLGAASLPAEATAQAPANDFLRRQADEHRNERLERLKQATPDDAELAVPSLGPELQRPGGCLAISRVVVDGAVSIDRRALDRLIAPYRDRCIALADINVLLTSLSNLYLDRGFIAARAYVPQQDIAATRVLRLAVVEGELTDIYRNGKPAAGDRSLASAFPGLKGKAANLRDIEQGLDQINRLSSNHARSAMLPGGANGASILDIENTPGKRWHATVANNNLGQQSTGLSQSSASLTLDDLLGVNDQLRLSYSRSGPDYPWGGDGYGHSNSYSANASIPYGYWTVSANGSWYEYDSSVPGNFGPIATSGSSAQAGLAVDRVIARDNVSITTLHGALTYKQTDNFLLGNRIEVGSRAYTVGTLGLSHSRQMLGGVVAFDLSLDQGLDLFNAVKAGEPGAGDADPRFTRINTAISASRPFELAGERLELTTLLSGQYSPDNLLGAEQMALGGYSNVRGSRDSLLYGNNGWFIRNDLVWRTHAFDDSAWKATLGELRAYVGLDYGQVFQQTRFDLAGGDLAGWTVGVKLTGGHLNLDVGYSKIFTSSIARPDAGLFFASASLRW